MAQATKTKTMFRQETAVAIDISAPAQRVWALLTDLPGFTRWNSTIISAKGTIADGETVTIQVKLAPERTFSLKVRDVVPNQQMVWFDGNFIFRGVRTYRLTPTSAGVRFEMSEVNTGLMLPMIAPSLPDFRPSFQDYAEDLKKAAEAGA